MRDDLKKWMEGEGERVLKQVGIKTGQIILDFGCGSGNYSLPIAKIIGDRGRLFALDKNGTDLDKLTQRARKEKLENIEIIKTKGELILPFKDEFFDVVVLYDVLHFYYFSFDERKKLLREVYRVLKQNSFLSVYPEHMGLEEIKREIEDVNFYLESKYLKKLIHEDIYTKGYILNFKKKRANRGQVSTFDI